jgi:phage baseplate assembly protein W
MALKRITPGLSDTTLVTTIPKRYIDIDSSFARKNGTVFNDGVRRGDVYKKLDVKAIDQSIKNILLTNKGEKPFDPDFGADLRKLLFELNTTVSEPLFRDTIREAIVEYEPRVRVKDVVLYDPGADEQVPRGISDIFFYKTGTGDNRYSLLVTVITEIRNTGQEVTSSINMNRLR